MSLDPDLYEVLRGIEDELNRIAIALERLVMK